MMNDTLNDKIAEAFSKLSLYCVAIYFGGSRVDPVIENPHDYDYISFSKPLHKHFLLNLLRKLRFRIGKSAKKEVKKIQSNSNIFEDFSQIRAYPYTQITWFSYLDPLMIKVAGEDVCPKTDIIIEHRREFIADLKLKAAKLNQKIIGNQKRWYHILRGIYILLNNSYDVTEEQKREINILHDLTPGWEEIRDKTIKLLDSLED